MREKRVEDRIVEMIRHEAGVERLEIDANRDFRSQVQLDSMQFVAIAARVEDELDIELPAKAMSVSTLRDFVDIVVEQVNGSALTMSQSAL
jgi:acyl carrier protein